MRLRRSACQRLPGGLQNHDSIKGLFIFGSVFIMLSFKLVNVTQQGCYNNMEFGNLIIFIFSIEEETPKHENESILDKLLLLICKALIASIEQ